MPETFAAHVEKKVGAIAAGKALALADAMRGRGFGDHDILEAIQECRDMWIMHLSKHFNRRSGCA